MMAFISCQLLRLGQPGCTNFTCNSSITKTQNFVIKINANALWWEDLTTESLELDSIAYDDLKFCYVNMVMSSNWTLLFVWGRSRRWWLIIQYSLTVTGQVTTEFIRYSSPSPRQINYLHIHTVQLACCNAVIQTNVEQVKRCNSKRVTGMCSECKQPGSLARLWMQTSKYLPASKPEMTLSKSLAHFN
jgi:hypothetical protein